MAPSPSASTPKVTGLRLASTVALLHQRSLKDPWPSGAPERALVDSSGEKPKKGRKHLKLLAGGLDAKKPWEERPGVRLPEEELREACREWDAATWEEYLKTVEVARHEDVGVTEDRAKLLDELGSSSGSPDEQGSLDQADWHPYADEAPRARSLDGSPFESIRQLVIDKVILEALSDNEELVIFRIFWEGRTEREIANLMKRSRRTVRTWRERAFSKLRVILSPILRISESTTHESSDSSKSS